MTNIRVTAHFTDLRKFRNFVFATEVTIFSDHNHLMHLRECAPKSAKLTRWALGLQEFMHADSNIFHTAPTRPDATKPVGLVGRCEFGITSCLMFVRLSVPSVVYSATR